MGLGFGETETAELGFVNLELHFADIVDRYEFGAYEVDVLIVQAEKVFPAWPWHYGWKGRVQGNIKRLVVPGNHFEMFTAEHAPVVARRIAPYVAALDPR